MRIYISGPYSNGDLAYNVLRAIEVATRLLEAGHAPFIPHLSHYWHKALATNRISYEQWLDYGLAWIEKCDALLRLDGYSPGADKEVERAQELGIKVYVNVLDILYEGLYKWS